MERQILRDIGLLQDNLKSRINEWIERGHDLDDLFYEMKDDEEIKFDKQEDLQVDKSAIVKNLKFRLSIGLMMP